jgi:hypothetical protein
VIAATESAAESVAKKNLELATFVSNQFALTSDAYAPVVTELDFLTQFADFDGNVIVVGKLESKGLISSLLGDIFAFGIDGSAVVSIGRYAYLINRALDS